jgi:branched-chain amino acid transport system permease protein
VFIGAINFFGLRFSLERFMIIVFAYLIIVGLMVFLKTSKRGQAMRAVAQDYDAARLLGINTKRIAMLGMFIGVGLSAVAGAIIAPVFSVNAYMGEFLMLKAFLVIVIGGLGSVPGAIYAAFLIGFVESFGLTYFGHITNVFLFVIVMLVLLVKPTGLFSGTVFQIR